MHKVIKKEISKNANKKKEERKRISNILNVKERRREIE